MSAAPRTAAHAVRRELLLLLLATLASLIVTWPLGRELFNFTRLADRKLDDYVYWWDFWWVHEALVVRHVSPFFCPDLFHPHGASLVVSPLALPFALLSLPLQEGMGVLPGVVAAVKLFGFATFPLALYGFSLLARSLGIGLVPSLLAGALFAFTPFRMLHLGRIHYLAGAFVPFFLHAAGRAIDTRRWRWTIAAGGWFALAGATDASLLLELLLSAGALWGWKLSRGAPWRAATTRLIACGALGSFLLLPLLVPFLSEARANAGAAVATRLDYDDEPDTVQRMLSPDLHGLAYCISPALYAPCCMDPSEARKPTNLRSSARLTADIYESFRPPSSWPQLDAAIAALVIVAVAGAILAGTHERGAWCFAALAACGFLLALGPQRGDGDASVRMPYYWLARVIPGMAAGRYPAAHLRLLQLGVALAAACSSMRARRWPIVAGSAALVAFLAIEPLRPLRFEPVRFEQVHELIAADQDPGAVLELPPRTEVVLRRMALGQILHHRALMAGPLTRVPPSSWTFFTDEAVVSRLLHPPQPRSADDPGLRAEVAENLAVLKRYGVRFIVLRRALRESQPQAFEWLIWYLQSHGLKVEPTREGHLLARIDA